jgi:hypothetical protein
MQLFPKGKNRDIAENNYKTAKKALNELSSSNKRASND